jgi:hypothetical protein
MDWCLEVREVVGESPWRGEQIQVAQENMCVAGEHEQVARDYEQLARAHAELARAHGKLARAYERLAYEYKWLDLWVQVHRLVDTSAGTRFSTSVDYQHLSFLR